ncbi:hypothetical protein H4582DRAFT_2078406 [Lactarius indigo]|nr:hypothetical protein H4582DRAFT_2078406 [Lactarius indigo]
MPTLRPSPSPSSDSSLCKVRTSRTPAHARPWAPPPAPRPLQRRASVSPRHALEADPPSGRPTSELLAPPFKPQKNFHHYGVTLEEMAAASLDVDVKEELSAMEQWFKVLSEAERTIQSFITFYSSSDPLLHHRPATNGRADLVIALLSPAVEVSNAEPDGSQACKYESQSAGLKSTMPGSPIARTFNTSATNRRSLAFDSSSSFLSPDTANTGGNPSDSVATLA